MFNQPSVTREAALLGALRNRRLVGSLLTQKNSTIFPHFPILQANRCSIHRCWPWPLVNSCFCTNSCRTVWVFGSLALCHKKVPRSNLRSCHNFNVWRWTDGCGGGPLPATRTTRIWGEPMSVVVALYRRLEELLDVIFIFYLSTKISIFFQE